MNNKNINLMLADYSCKCVESVLESDVNNNEYSTIVKKMNTLIQKNGLIATLVFNYSKCKKKHHEEVWKNMINWHLQNPKTRHIGNIKQADSFKVYIEKITSLSPLEYRLLTKEFMILFGWIKRFSEGMIGE